MIGAGPAGLAAAVAAGEHGLKTVVFEKNGVAGGTANMGMGPLGIDTDIQRQGFNDISVPEALEEHMTYTHYRVDEDLVQTYFNLSADTIKWLQDMGVQFAGAFKYFKESNATWHVVQPDDGSQPGPGAAADMNKHLKARAEKLGATFYLETPATSITTADGKITGITAQANNGQQYAVTASAVLVATGGFGSSKQMLHDELGLNLNEDFFTFNVPGIEGDGLRMMWQAGANKDTTSETVETIYLLPDNFQYFNSDAALRQPNLLINQRGDRFMNEGDMGNTTYTGNALRLQPGNYGYCVMDQSLLDDYKANGPAIADIVHPASCFDDAEGEIEKAQANNYEGIIVADTLSELAEKLGINETKLQQTIDDYNQLCVQNLDTQFHKPAKFLKPIRGNGCYIVGKYFTGAYSTLGGIRTNKFGEVYADATHAVPGLYSAGQDANTIYGDSYNFTLPGNSMGFAVNSGRMAANGIAAYLNERSSKAAVKV
ncbi:succinate dehydrogenase [Secundilactobacillus paracollinoides]|uniref:Succinate dehydrogenase n=1 Tax=Secundilactobacillus paracollinoides TaxID=240427 RepID=A0A1B2J294_9LACO|nr:succinate dehydrogenase [Secundilactobacillus paracollinoides]ANZ68425.1 succinate dehydrogenase [Secundilactobacillus paracollinoides]